MKSGAYLRWPAAARAPFEGDAVDRRPEPGNRLRWFMAATSSAHLVGFCVVLGLNKDQLVPLSRPYIMWPHSAANSTAPAVFSFGMEPTTKISMKWLIAAFFFLSFIFQILPCVLPEARAPSWAAFATREARARARAGLGEGRGGSSARRPRPPTRSRGTCGS